MVPHITTTWSFITPYLFKDKGCPKLRERDVERKECGLIEDVNEFYKKYAKNMELSVRKDKAYIEKKG